ncbi:MAG: helix-turn-helix transcriptional regulator [Ktedonobacteraceae bacterium]|nr:helix-turn-helix transcriptional regulator [Ktedonobacteraceae bacterium]
MQISKPHETLEPPVEGVRVIFKERPSDSPYVERVWSSYSQGCGMFTSIAATHWMMVVTRLQGKITLDIQGPETKATQVYCPADGEWTGILFKFGTCMPLFPTSTLVDGGVTLPLATRQSFWLHGSGWQFPSYENAETFVDWLVRGGLLVAEPAIESVLRGQPNTLSARSLQRRFLTATGMSHTAARLIERARLATILLQQGLSIQDVVYQAGYFDQSHLIRELKRFIGWTPAQIKERNQSGQLSFLYNTDLFE